MVLFWNSKNPWIFNGKGDKKRSINPVLNCELRNIKDGSTNIIKRQSSTKIYSLTKDLLIE